MNQHSGQPTLSSASNDSLIKKHQLDLNSDTLCPHKGYSGFKDWDTDRADLWHS
uniref:Uncharacterized protein n=1 Tax=Anguilla anguilla TaxID=7936 RepID=A0A0E9RN49_ANGAN